MFSDEDFSLVTNSNEQGSLTSLEETLKELHKCKLQHKQLMDDQAELIRARQEQMDFAQQFSQRNAKLIHNQEEDERNYARETDEGKKKLAMLQEESSSLKRDILRAEEELREAEERNARLRLQTDVPTAVPERKVIYKGVMGKEANGPRFDIKPHVVYPMEGGTALITFEEESVAQKIMCLKVHSIPLGECAFKLQAHPMQILMPSKIEMNTLVCPRRILVSNTPKMEDEERLLDKLELHFSKRKNGGGEVERSELQQDSGNVVITFVENTVAKGLIDQQWHEVDIQNKKYKVKVTPFLNANIQNIQTHVSVCQRTILLKGIPDIMEQEDLQDNLMIHFQKTTNGGGEVEVCVYNPVGQCTLAVFEEDLSDKAESQ